MGTDKNIKLHIVTDIKAKSQYEKAHVHNQLYYQDHRSSWHYESLCKIVRKKELIPLFSAVGFGCAMGIGMLGRYLTKHPEVTWSPARNQHPWRAIKPNQSTGLLRPNDTSSFCSRPAPDEAYAAIGQ